MWKHDVFAVVLICVLIWFMIRYLSVQEGFSAVGMGMGMGMEKEMEKDNMFYTAEQTKTFLMYDNDMYTRAFTQWDLIARKSATEIDYRHKVMNAVMDFTEDQKGRLRKAAKRADAFFEKYVKTCDFDLTGITTIPWVFALTRGKVYEDGCPHTRANVIFLSTIIDETPKELYRLLVHEKLHLYQRLYPDNVLQYIAHKGYEQWTNRYAVPRARSNPDINPWVYIDPATKLPMIAVFSSDTPTSMTDVVIKTKYEHPFEAMAYDIQEIALFESI